MQKSDNLKTELAEREDLEAKLACVNAALALREKELDALRAGAKAVLEQKDFAASARAIFDHCRALVGATSGYVALLSADGQENELLFLESGGLPCDVNPELPMPIRGLRAEAYRENKAVYHNDFMRSKWADFMPAGHLVLKNVMFAPLVIEQQTVGIIGLANKEGDFTANDAKMAAGFGELAAIALQNSRSLERRIKAEQETKQLVDELRGALAQVKQLSGLLPICSHCKKIRDDQGYWQKIEAYIQKHSNAAFSHSICKECAQRLYPELNTDSAYFEWQ
jgi:transcriptional regulator with GAF, ATPase, and Fis domain